jgi:hypothetical protein
VRLYRGATVDRRYVMVEIRWVYLSLAWGGGGASLIWGRTARLTAPGPAA